MFDWLFKKEKEPVTDTDLVQIEFGTVKFLCEELKKAWNDNDKLTSIVKHFNSVVYADNERISKLEDSSEDLHREVHERLKGLQRDYFEGYKEDALSMRSLRSALRSDIDDWPKVESRDGFNITLYGYIGKIRNELLELQQKNKELEDKLEKAYYSMRFGM